MTDLDHDKPIRAFEYRYWSEHGKCWQRSDEEHEHPSGIFWYPKNPDIKSGGVFPRYVHVQSGDVDDTWEPDDLFQDILCTGDFQ